MRAIYYFFLTALIIFSSCKKDSNPVGPDKGINKIQVGESIEVISNQSIGTSGGTIKVDKTGDKLDGFEITIPENAFTQTKTFKVSYAEIKSHQLGQYFNPITPMISISYEGGYSDKPIQVKVPIKLPKDYFAMGYFYDEETGKLEGLPVESLDSNYIVVSTRTFSRSSSLGKSSGLNDLTSIWKMIISSISESDLKKQIVMASGFLPGVDDWEFINKGSYIAPGGHCAGQSMTMMWYYYEKKLKGEQSLFHRFDEVNDKTKPELLWQDNLLGYRFASTIQKDFNFDGWIKSLEWKQFFPRLTFDAFAAAILITGEPQFVLIRNSAGKGGHAMVVYKVNMNEQKLYIADPNYPNNRVPADGSESIRTIDLVSGVLKPYETGLVAGAQSITMDQIGYFGKTAYIDWTQMAKRWTEFENKTIGNDRFPAYQLWEMDGTGNENREITDGYFANSNFIGIANKSTQCLQFLPGTDHKQLLKVYDQKGKLLAYGDTAHHGIADIKLKLGLNKLGIYAMGARDNGGDYYVDFKWLTITKDTLVIEPNYFVGQQNKEYKFTARTFGTAPNPYKMVWNFGDSSPEVTVNNDSTVKHTFTLPSELMPYEVNVKMYNQANQKLAEASSEADISINPVTIISSSSDGIPVSKPGIVGKEYSFIARHNGQAPKSNAKFVWNFGDNTPDVTIMNDSLVTHTFTKSGSYTISVKIYDNNIYILDGSVKAEIKNTTILKTESTSGNGAPILTPGEKNVEYSFVARTYGTAPNQYKMVWNFGDNTSEITVNNDSTAKHRYSSDNNYNINVKLYNQSNVKLAEDNVEAEIISNELSITGIDPAFAPFGDTINISGKGFGNTQGSGYVTFNVNERAAIQLWSDNLIKAIVPNGAVTGNITVYVGSKSSSSNSYFTSQGNLIDTLLTKKRIHCFYAAYLYLTDGDSSSYSLGIDSDTYPAEYPEIVWSGKTFTMERTKWDLSEKMIGTFSDDGFTLLSLRYEYVYSVTPGRASPYKVEKGFTVKNIPFINQWVGISTFRLHASEGLENNTTELYINQYYLEGGNTKVVKIKNVNWFHRYLQATFILGI